MNPDLQLRFLKVLVNVPVWVLDRLLTAPSSPRFPQTEILLRVYSRLAKVYRLDCLQGTFGAEPDGNFQRLTQVFMKVLARISENDRYYRAWLGLSLLLVKHELEAIDTRPTVLKSLIKEQWRMNINFLPDASVAEFRDEFVEMALCDYLGNLARMNPSSWTGSEKR